MFLWGFDVFWVFHASFSKIFLFMNFFFFAFFIQVYSLKTENTKKCLFGMFSLKKKYFFHFESGETFFWKFQKKRSQRSHSNVFKKLWIKKKRATHKFFYISMKVFFCCFLVIFFFSMSFLFRQFLFWFGNQKQSFLFRQPSFWFANQKQCLLYNFL